MMTDREAWHAAVRGIAKIRMWLNWTDWKMIKKPNKNGNSTYIFNEYNTIVIFLLLAFVTSGFQEIFPFHLESSLIPQLVKNLLAMQETPVWFLGWEDLLGKG